MLVGIKVGEIGEDRFTMHFRIVSTRHHRIAAEGDGVIVSYDYRAWTQSASAGSSTPGHRGVGTKNIMSQSKLV